MTMPSQTRTIDLFALGCGLATFAVHAALAGRYDLFRDELYFIVCGQHPAFGYADQPPLVPLLAAALHGLGGGVGVLRMPVALGAGALVWLAVRFTRLLGGDPVATVLAALTCAIAPMLMGLVATFNTSVFDPLMWTALAYLLVRYLRLENPRDLLLGGLVAGLTLEIKYAVLFWLAGLTLGLFATPERRVFKVRELYFGALLAAGIAAPSFVWQALHGFPFLELGAAAKVKNADVGLLPFLGNQAVVMNPAFAPLWLAGLAAPFAVRSLRDLCFVPIACAVVLAIVRIGHGKDYYLAPLYPTLFVIGAVAIAPLWQRARGKAVIGIFAVAGIAASAAVAPITLPILPPARVATYMRAIGFAPQQQERSFAGTELPQQFADQLGWHDFAAQVETAWAKIPVAERGRTAILVENYGEAAALDLYTALPPALSGHNQYFLWGLRGQNPASLLLIVQPDKNLIPFCTATAQLGTTFSRWAMAYENGKAIVLCRGLKQPLGAVWPMLKHFV